MTVSAPKIIRHGKQSRLYQLQEDRGWLPRLEARHLGEIQAWPHARWGQSVNHSASISSSVRQRRPTAAVWVAVRVK